MCCLYAVHSLRVRFLTSQGLYTGKGFVYVKAAEYTSPGRSREYWLECSTNSSLSKEIRRPGICLNTPTHSTHTALRRIPHPSDTVKMIPRFPSMWTWLRCVHGWRALHYYCCYAGPARSLVRCVVYRNCLRHKALVGFFPPIGICSGACFVGGCCRTSSRTLRDDRTLSSLA